MSSLYGTPHQLALAVFCGFHQNNGEVALRPAAFVGPPLARRGCPKLAGTILGVPMIRIIVFGDLYWGPRKP